MGDHRRAFREAGHCRGTEARGDRSLGRQVQDISPDMAAHLGCPTMPGW